MSRYLPRLPAEHGRRHILHFNATFHPAAAWIIQQLRQACPYVTFPAASGAPRFLTSPATESATRVIPSRRRLGDVDLTLVVAIALTAADLRQTISRKRSRSSIDSSPGAIHAQNQHVMNQSQHVVAKFGFSWQKSPSDRKRPHSPSPCGLATPPHRSFRRVLSS